MAASGSTLATTGAQLEENDPLAVATTPLYFGRCFGFLHAPAAGQARNRGVVLCNPGGYEALCVHRPWAKFAAALAEAGFPTLRFDYPGCGDSAESDEDPARVRAWLDGIREAVATLRCKARVDEVVLVGLRLGATLAVAAAQELAAAGGPVDGLVLLAPGASGEAVYKELRVLAMMAKARAATTGEAASGIEAAGFHYTPATIAELKALDLARDQTPLNARTLILERNDGTGGPVLAGLLRSRGATVNQQGFDGYGALMRDALDTEYPASDFRRVIDWLGEGAPRGTRPAGTPLTVATLPLPGGSERPVTIGPAGLFGIISEPARPAPGRPAMLILNTGANHRIGTNRLSVLLARRLLREGVTVLRMDCGGLGDSPSVADRADKTILRAALVDDVRQGVDFLAAAGHQEIVVNGLCAGGWLAWHAALADPRITGQILLNLQNLWPVPSAARGGSSNREYFRLLRQKETWLRLVRGDLQFGALAILLAGRVWAKLATPITARLGRIRGAETVVGRTERALKSLAARNVETVLVFVHADAGLDEMALHFGPDGRDLAGRPGLNLLFIEKGDHLFSIKSSRDHLLELMAAQFATGRFVPAAAPAGAAAGWSPKLQGQIA
jgi:pimeloyl-ACP methyl ester carboxylesterase